MTTSAMGDNILMEKIGKEPSGSLICFSHLRWEFVVQRPQHLMSRFAQHQKVIYWEEPVFGADNAPLIDLRTCPDSGVVIATPRLPSTLSVVQQNVALRYLLDGLLAVEAGPLTLWYYTPMMLPISRHIDAQAVVYDCMDELANFKFAPPELVDLETQLLAKADVVFTGGYSLYEAKRKQHGNIHPFPSSVDRDHFATARQTLGLPTDMANTSGPRLGYYGVIDERVDLDLIAQVADSRPDWSIVMVGPVVKIDHDMLPQRPNIHWLGGKEYRDLPSYLGNWDVALMPFAVNESTRFISPTKTPEYLAGGRTVVSTPITDVIRHFGMLDAVHIASNADEFVKACEAALEQASTEQTWRDEADRALADLSWDRTFSDMQARIADVRRDRRSAQPIVSPTSWPVEQTRRYDYLIVGAGYAGSVMAERLANDAGKRVLVIDRRSHIAGNAFDCVDDSGIMIHQYGPHIFHTNSAEIFSYLSRFTKWHPYEHRVLASVDGKLVPMPINRTTLNVLYGLTLETDEDAETWLASRAEPVEVVETSADVVISKVGTDLYEKFFRGYTRKQWGLDPSELDKSVTARVPTRTNTDDRYFTDTFQAMPLDGYTAMFRRMLDHPRIDVMLGVDYADIQHSHPHRHLIFTGPIDEYFGYRYGALPYRSLRFEHKTIDADKFQQVATVNYPSEDVPYTRITEYKHLTGQVAPKTSVTYEYPCDEGDPYYPVPREANQKLFKRYEALALRETGVTFVGRLATYRYYNMDQVVGQALATYRRLRSDEAHFPSSNAWRETTTQSA